jgi:ADP-ribosylation factor-like protein 8
MKACSPVSCRATEMDVTMIGLQNAGKSSLLRVLAVSSASNIPTLIFGILTDRVSQGGEFTVE